MPPLWRGACGYEGSTFTIPRSYHINHQGSIIALAGSDGKLLAINSYDEYGIPASTNMGRFQYTGQAWLPKLGMYHYKARIYSPTLGRFLQTDPIGYDDQINLYAYVSGDPVNGRDPKGTQAQALAPLLCVGPQAVLCATVVVGGTAVVACVAYCGNVIDYIFKNESSVPKGPIATDDKGKVHGDLPDAADVDSEDVEASVGALDDSIGVKEAEVASKPRGDPNGSRNERDRARQRENHEERIRREKELRDELRDRMKE